MDTLDQKMMFWMETKSTWMKPDHLSEAGVLNYLKEQMGIQGLRVVDMEMGAGHLVERRQHVPL